MHDACALLDRKTMTSWRHWPPGRSITYDDPSELVSQSVGHQHAHDLSATVYEHDCIDSLGESEKRRTEIVFWSDIHWSTRFPRLAVRRVYPSFHPHPLRLTHSAAEPNAVPRHLHARRAVLPPVTSSTLVNPAPKQRPARVVNRSLAEVSSFCPRPQGEVGDCRRLGRTVGRRSIDFRRA